MTFFLSRLSIALGTLAGLSFLMSPASSFAQVGVVKETFGEWKLICDTPAGASSEQCAMVQVVLDEETEIGLSVAVLQTADGRTTLMRVAAPLGVVLPSGLGLIVDEKNIGSVPFRSCFSDGCYAEVIPDEQLLETLSNGKSATFIVFRTPEEGIGVPIELSGFAEAYEALGKANN